MTMSTANAALVHEYLFDTDASDSVGTANGTLEGTASVVGSKLVLTGGGAGNSYVALPGGIASAASAGGAAGEISIETYLNLASTGDWRVIFSFGNSGPDAMDGNGSDGDYWQLIPHAGVGGNPFRSTTHIAANSETPADAPTMVTGESVHLVNVLNATANTNELYVNGALLGTSALQAGFDPSVYGTVGDTQNWLGRSQWGDDSLDASYEDFRIYDHALDQAEVTAAYLAAIPEPATLALLATASIAMFVRRRIVS